MPGSRVLGGGAGGAETRSRERLREHHSHRGSGTTLHVTLLSPILEFCFSGILLGTLLLWLFWVSCLGLSWRGFPPCGDVPGMPGTFTYQRDQVLSGEDRI
jgi:hypothetical protein